MNAADTIQAAIERLEAQRAAAVGGPWVIESYERGPRALEQSGGGAFISDVGESVDPAQIDTATAELLVTLHRTIAAQLAILREALEFYENSRAIGMPDGEMAEYYGGTLDLARAILGDAN